MSSRESHVPAPAAADASAERAARSLAEWRAVLTAASGALLVVIALVMGLFVVVAPDFERHVGLPVPVLFVGMLLLGAGSLLATVTPAARAWHHAQRAGRAARRTAKSLADWRSTDEKATRDA